MKKLFTLSLFIQCCAIAALAQTTVSTGLSKPIGLAINGNQLYVSEFAGNKISQIDLGQPLPIAATALLNGVTKPTGLLVVGEYLYFNTEFDIPAANETKTGRIDLTNANPTIEQVVATNVGLGHQALLRNGNTLYISSNKGSTANDGGIYKIDLNLPFPQTPVPVLQDINVSGMAIRGNELFYGYFSGSEVFKIDVTQPNPTPQTVISGLSGPDGLTFSGDFLYISESSGSKIVKIDAAQSNPVAETVASGLSNPTLSVFDGLDLYFGQQGNGTVSKISITQLAFPNPATVCSSEMAAQGGGGTPLGGTYSGPNVMDNGNGETFTFNAQAAGVGSHIITYSFGALTTTAMIQVIASDVASFSYSATGFCVNGNDPMPTITGLAGGTFTSTPTGLSINGTFGLVDVSASTPNTYTVTYTTAGACPNSSNVNMTINALDDASFSYSASSYCIDSADPSPTVTGLGGGSFSSTPAGLIINSSTGSIDVSASTPNTYTITYLTAGTCSNSSNVSVIIKAADDLSFSYSASSYCVGSADPSPTVTGLGGGLFSSTPTGLSINGSTGSIDLDASTPGTYSVTYTNVGACPNSISENVAINALDDATFSYGSAGYDIDGTDPTPTVTGLSGGTFSSAPAGLNIDAASGLIDLSASTSNTYTIIYTSAGICPNSSSFALTINDVATPPPGDDCTDAQDINILFGGPLNEPQTSAIWDNTNATSANDPTNGIDCFYQGDGLQHTIWYSFTSPDGSMYGIRTIQCNAVNYITDGDSQMAIYSGDDCGNLTPVACGEDEDPGLNAYVELPTDAGMTYYIMVDGYSTHIGEFCLEVTNLAPNAVSSLEETDIQLFPNPTSGRVRLENIEADKVQVFDNMGRLVFSKKQPGADIDISEVPAGFYFMKIHADGKVYPARVVME